MHQIIFMFVLLAVICANTEARTPQLNCSPICRQNETSPIRCVTDSNRCHKMQQCSIEEENCRRNILNERSLIYISPANCRKIKGPLGSGPCACKKTIRRERASRDCRLRCANPSKKLNCYRTRNNKCQLLTNCQLSRVNCERGNNNPLTLVNNRHCNGMKVRQGFRNCRG